MPNISVIASGQSATGNLVTRFKDMDTLEYGVAAYAPYGGLELAYETYQDSGTAQSRYLALKAA